MIHAVMSKKKTPVTEKLFKTLNPLTARPIFKFKTKSTRKVASETGPTLFRIWGRNNKTKYEEIK